jgi:hypothetical protein
MQAATRKIDGPPARAKPDSVAYPGPYLTKITTI